MPDGWARWDMIHERLTVRQDCATLLKQKTGGQKMCVCKRPDRLFIIVLSICTPHAGHEVNCVTSWLGRPSYGKIPTRGTNLLNASVTLPSLVKTPIPYLSTPSPNERKTILKISKATSFNIIRFSIERISPVIWLRVASFWDWVPVPLYKIHVRPPRELGIFVVSYDSQNISRVSAIFGIDSRRLFQIWFALCGVNSALWSAKRFGYMQEMLVIVEGLFL